MSAKKAAPEPPARPATPELDRLVAVSEESQKLGEFLEWLEDKGYHLAKYGEDPEQLYPAYEPTNSLLAAYFDIDLDRVEQERRAILAYVTEVQA